MTDETETIRKMLYQSWTAQEEIEENCMTLQRLKDSAEKITTTLSPAPAHAGVSDKVGGCACKMADIECQIKASIENLTAIISRNTQIITGVKDDTLRLLLRKRYLNHKEWDCIAYEMKYRTRGIHTVHERALKAAKLSYDRMKRLENQTHECTQMHLNALEMQ